MHGGDVVLGDIILHFQQIRIYNLSQIENQIRNYDIDKRKNSMGNIFTFKI